MLRRWSFLILVSVVSLVYFGTAASQAILDDEDALYAHVAQRMSETGDWVTPRANGVRLLDRPPMTYWLMAASFSAFGSTESAARLPTVLSVLGIGILLFLAGRRADGDLGGLIAGIAGTLCVGTFLFTRVALPDVLFVFFLTLALHAFTTWYLNERNPVVPALAFHASLAGAVLTKGLVGLLLPSVIAGLFLIRMRSWRRIRGLHAGKGALLFLSLSLPWHILAAYRNPGFLWHFFVNEQFLRFLGRRQPAEYDSISLPVSWALILLWLFPWSTFLPAALHLRRRMVLEVSPGVAVVQLSVIWTLVALAFFSLSSRIDYQSLPLLPPLALLAGLALSPGGVYEPSSDYRRKSSVRHIFAVLGIAGGVSAASIIAAFAAWLSGNFRVDTLLSIRSLPLRAYTHYFDPIFDMPPAVVEKLLAPLVIIAAAVSLGLLAAWWFNRRGGRMKAVMVLSGVMVVFCVCAIRSLSYCEEVLSSRQFGRKIVEVGRPGDVTIIVGDYEAANSLSFYAPVALEVYGGRAGVLEWGLRFDDAPKLLLSRSDLLERWSGARRVFLLAPDQHVPALELSPVFPLLRSAGRTLVCNKPPRP